MDDMQVLRQYIEYYLEPGEKPFILLTREELSELKLKQEAQEKKPATHCKPKEQEK